MSTDEEVPLLSSKQYTSFCRVLLICINACLSAFFVGYSLIYMGTLPNFQFIIDTYHIGSHSTFSLTQSLVQGCVPVGAIFGALSSGWFLKRFSRK